MSYDSLILANASFYLKLDETSGTVAADASANARDFTNTSATVNQTKVNPSGVTSYDFNGTSSKLAFASDSWMNTATFSVCAWIRADNLSALRCIGSRDSSGAGWAFYTDSTGKLNAFFPGNGNSHLGTTVLSTATTYFVVMTCDVANTQTKFYINGALDATIAAVPTGTPGNQFRIGNSHGSNASDAINNFYFDGRIDDFSFHAGTVLTLSDVSTLYTAGTGASASGTGSLSLSGSGAATTSAAGAGSLSLSGSGAAVAPTTGTGSLTLSGAGVIDFMPAVGDGSLTLSASGGAGIGVTGTGSLSLSGDGAAVGSTSATGTGSLTLSATGGASLGITSSGFLTLSGAATAEVLYATDTSNLRNGRRRFGLAAVTVIRPVEAIPVSVGTRVDKAMAYPTPTMVDGRPT